ncbi:hypothetical protein QCA50_017081 [Cerrena zonata]|uniref:Uncharacterized protein n=1 Tax=Cerrena zonata TaxID=2478898 RepID=A0AAW0FRG0_9APHY
MIFAAVVVSIDRRLIISSAIADEPGYFPAYPVLSLAPELEPALAPDPPLGLGV